MKTIRQQQKDRYRKANLKTISFECNINTDADILELLASQENKSRYIKNLLREQIQANNT